MMKIFIGDHELLVGSRKDIELRKEFASAKIPSSLTALSSNPTKKDIALIHDFFTRDMKAPVKDVLFSESEKDFERALFSFYKLISAAGGVVKNSDGKVLMMFRRGKWDLPKGKVDKGETIRHAAKREVMEETGIGKLKVIDKIKFLNGEQDCTYHTYEINGKPVIKATYWFEMFSDEKSLTPQLLEGITAVGWYSKKEVQEHLKNSYHSVEWILSECGIV